MSFLTTGNLDNFYIDVSNYSNGSSAEQCAYERVRFVPGETRVYTCPCGMFGRYVRVRFAATVRSYLQLCEVQIQSGGTQNNSHCKLQCKVRIHVMSLIWTILSCTDNIFYNSMSFENRNSKAENGHLLISSRSLFGILNLPLNYGDFVSTCLLVQAC